MVTYVYLVPHLSLLECVQPTIRTPIAEVGTSNYIRRHKTNHLMCRLCKLCYWHASTPVTTPQLLLHVDTHTSTHTCTPTHNTQIYKQTQDEHFELVIMDFNSSDLDVEEVLRNSSLKR